MAPWYILILTSTVLVLGLTWSVCISLTHSLALTPTEQNGLSGSKISEESQQWQQPEGRRQEPEGRRQQPEGRRQQPEGRRQQPEVTLQQPEGRQQQPEGRRQDPEKTRQEVEDYTQELGGRVMLEDIRHWLSPRQLEKLRRMKEILQRRERLKAQGHKQSSLERQRLIKKRLVQKRRHSPAGGQGMRRRLKQKDLQLLLSPKQLRRAQEEEERLRREAKPGGQKKAQRLCSIRGQRVMREQEGRCISSGAACRSEGLLYPDEACRRTPLDLCFVAVEDQRPLDGQCGEGRSAGVCRHFPPSGLPVIQPDHPSCEPTGLPVPSAPCPSCQSLPRPAPQASHSSSL